MAAQRENNFPLSLDGKRTKYYANKNLYYDQYMLISWLQDWFNSQTEMDIICCMDSSRRGSDMITPVETFS